MIEQRKPNPITLPIPADESALTRPGGGDIRGLIEDWLKSRGLRTREAYWGDLKDFARFMGAETPVPPMN